MANPKISIHPATALAFVANVAPITDAQSYHKHVVGFTGNGANTMTLAWSPDDVTYYDIEAKTVASGTFFLDQAVPFLRLTRSGGAGTGHFYHYNSQSASKV